MSKHAVLCLVFFDFEPRPYFLQWICTYVEVHAGERHSVNQERISACLSSQSVVFTQSKNLLRSTLILLTIREALCGTRY